MVYLNWSLVGLWSEHGQINSDTQSAVARLPSGFCSVYSQKKTKFQSTPDCTAWCTIYNVNTHSGHLWTISFQDLKTTSPTFPLNCQMFQQAWSPFGNLTITAHCADCFKLNCMNCLKIKMLSILTVFLTPNTLEVVKPKSPNVLLYFKISYTFSDQTQRSPLCTQ